MENRETKSSRLEQLLPEIRSKFADELEERATKPKQGYLITLEDIENVRIGNKIPAREISTRDFLVRLGQEYRLSPDEIDELISKVIDE